MHDNRSVLKSGDVIIHNSIRFKITGLIGMGGNAAVYTAEYRDSFLNDGIHKCIIKEHFPYHPEGLIYRDESGNIVVCEGAEEIYGVHRQNFIYGNSVHIDILGENPDSLGMNFDSFEYNNTIYTILSLNALSNLNSRLSEFDTPKKAAKFTVKLLRAADTFHKRNILHLDISPDNIIISRSNGENRVLLIDFNSCCYINADKKRESWLNINYDYSAPEVKFPGMAEISAASDIYSCCLIFLYLITGRVFKYTKYNFAGLLKNEKINSLPRSAAACFANIVAKALRTNPKLRYQKADEMIEALNEFIDRINNIGITHGALWEAARIICGSFNEEILENSILSEKGKISARELPCCGNCILTGEGGIGKTTLLKKLCFENTRIYTSSKTVFMYIPLYKYDGNKDFIRRYIVSKLNFGKNISTIAEAVRKLNDLMTNDKSGVYLMLDGYNEASYNALWLLREIEEISRMPKACVTVSARSAAVFKNSLKEFSVCELLPLDDEAVKEYLNRIKLPYSENLDIRRLLKNPLMLKLFVKTETVYKQSGEYHGIGSTQQEIIHSYLQSFCEAYKMKFPEDGKGLVRLSYSLEILFGAFCKEAVKNNNITFEKARSICQKEYKRLKTRAFSKAFARYAGKTENIIGGAEDADRWLNIVFNGILVNDTALIVNDNGIYKPVHMNLALCLNEDFKLLKKQYFKAAAGRRVPAALAGVFVCAVLTSAVYYYSPGTHPIGRSEITANNNIMAGVQQASYSINLMTGREERIISALKTEGREAALEEIYKEYYIFENADKYKTDINIEEYLYYGLNSEAVKKYYEMPYEHCVWVKDFYDRLKYALGNDSGYTDKYIETVFETYEEYTDTFKKAQAYRLCQIEKSVNKKGREPLEMLKSTDTYFMEYGAEAAALSDEEIEKLLDSNTGLCSKLEYLKTKLAAVKGE